MYPINNKSIGGALTTESGSNVSGRAGVNRGAQPGPHQANPEGVSGSQAGSGSTASVDLHEVQIENQFPREAQGNYLVDGAIDTYLLGTDPIGSQKGKNGPERQKFLCTQCRKKRWVIDSEAGCAAEMTRFTRCMFCVVEKRDERARMQLQAALLKEMEAVRLVTREQERQQQRTSVKSLALSESMSTESSTGCGPRLLGPLLNLSRKRLWLLLRELPGLRQILRVMPRRLAPRVEMRRRSSRMPMRGWLKKPLALTSDMSARFRKPRPGRSSLPIILLKKDAEEGDGGRGP